MSKFRVYLIPAGYIDFECDSVLIKPVLGRYDAIVNGGEHDKKVIKNVRGAKKL